MDAYTFEALEFSKVTEKLCSYAASELGRSLLKRQAPTADLARIRKRLSRVSEVKAVLEATSRFPVEGIRDVREFLAMARLPGAVLGGSAFIEISSTLEAACTLRDYLRSHARTHPHLTRVSQEIFVLTGLTRRIAATLDQDGGILDDASEDLAAIRGEIRHVEHRIRHHLKALLEASDSRDWLQEDYFTIREGRHVLPVKANLKGELPGIVHDRSDTGQTVFVEPAENVALGNELRDLWSLERVEINRILGDLTVAVAEVADDIETNIDILARADADKSRALLSREYGMCEPRVEKDADFRLRGARHPILLFQGSDAVPVDVELCSQSRTLVITGPNAGGKTVCLKTIGLLALMAQAGLHVPAKERSTFRLFRKIYADIGDNQSIEESLSSFSSHMQRIRSILDGVNDRTLVLLDELGAATDPEEGGALSAAVLAEMHDRGAFSAVTTHLSDLKILAHVTEGMANAGAQFDPYSGKPTYQIKAGTPGNSRAIETARQLGFPASLLEAARGNLTEGKARLEQTITDLASELDRAREQVREYEKLQKEARERRDKYRTALTRLRREKDEYLKKASREALETARSGRKLVQETIARLREEMAASAQGGDRKGKAAARKARETMESVFVEAKALERRHARPLPSDLPPSALVVGAEVSVLSLGQTGTIVSIDEKKGKVKVSAGIGEIEASFDDLGPPHPGAPVRPMPAKPRFTELARNVDRELMLLGCRVEEARKKVTDYLNEALLSGLSEVRIIHGEGTGALRKAVTEWLKGNHAVSSFRPGGRGEGGAGATVVTLGD
jgi:DNA mismatch repair protein MutS2